MIDLEKINGAANGGGDRVSLYVRVGEYLLRKRDKLLIDAK